MANQSPLLLEDLEFEGDFVKSASNGLQTITGLANLKQRLFARLITVPGTLVHRPNFGVGLKKYQNNISTFSQQNALANKIQEQFLLDPGVQDVVGISFDNTDNEPSLVVIQVSVIPVGYTDAIQMDFVPFGGGGS